jgi:hypothetical protein
MAHFVFKSNKEDYLSDSNWTVKAGKQNSESESELSDATLLLCFSPLVVIFGILKVWPTRRYKTHLFLHFLSFSLVFYPYSTPSVLSIFMARFILSFQISWATLRPIPIILEAAMVWRYGVRIMDLTGTGQQQLVNKTLNLSQN